eukprot:jgi/Tetstr1/430167/TSEL_019999.t1
MARPLCHTPALPRLADTTATFVCPGGRAFSPRPGSQHPRRGDRRQVPQHLGAAGRRDGPFQPDAQSSHSRVDERGPAESSRGRRAVLLGGGLIGAQAAAPPNWMRDTARAGDDLAARLTATTALAPTGRLTPPWEQQAVLRVPPWMLGTWQVTSKSVGFLAPQGNRFLPRAWSARRRSSWEVDTVEYTLNFVTSAGPTSGGLLGVGGKAREVVVADRAANIRAVTNSFQGYDAIESVAYDPGKDARRVTATFATQAPDGRRLPPQRIEVYINHIETQECLDEDMKPAFYCSELFRQVFVGVQRVEVNDYEICMGFHLLQDGRVAARQRNLVYLQPQDAAYFDVGGRAVGYYDYDLSLTRTALPEGTTTTALISCAPKPC